MYSHEGDNEDDGTQELGAVVKLDYSAHSSDVHNRSFCDYNFKGEDWQVRATDREIKRKMRYRGIERDRKESEVYLCSNNKC